MWAPQLLWVLLCWWRYRWRNIVFATAGIRIFLPALLFGPVAFGTLQLYFTLAWPAYLLTVVFILLRFIQRAPE